MVRSLEYYEKTLKRSLWDLYIALKNDADYWWSMLQEDEYYSNQYIRRAAIRATFGFFEGVISGLKQLLLSLAKDGRIFLSQTILN